MPSRTVRVVLRSITPCFAHLVKQPLLGGVNPKSLSISLKILTSEGGALTPSFSGTKRELKEKYNMAAFGSDNNGDEIVKEWYEQSAAFSKYVIGKTGEEVNGLEVQFVNDHYISTDEALLNAGCTIQITGIKAIVAKAFTNAR